MDQDGTIEIVFYAVVAALIFMRLWSVLGNKNENDMQQPSPYLLKNPFPKIKGLLEEIKKELDKKTPSPE